MVDRLEREHLREAARSLRARTATAGSVELHPDAAMAVADWLDVTARDVGTSSLAYHAAADVAEAVLAPCARCQIVVTTPSPAVPGESEERLRAVLADIAESLNGHCIYEMCDGPDAPRVDMATCRVCWAVQDARAALDVSP